MMINKYRAWVKSEKRYIVDTQDFIPLIVTNKGVMKLQPQFEKNYYEIPPLDWFIIEQFTGLHDDSEDEKEVYENDIVLVNYETNKIKAIVKFERGTFILVSDEFIDGYIPLFEVSESDREYEWINGVVIGNIHERSEDNDK